MLKQPPTLILITPNLCLPKIRYTSVFVLHILSVWHCYSILSTFNPPLILVPFTPTSALTIIYCNTIYFYLLEFLLLERDLLLGFNFKNMLINCYLNTRCSPEESKVTGQFCQDFPTLYVLFYAQTIEAVLNSFLLSTVVDSEEYPQGWRKLHQMTFPHISKLARNHL